MGARVSAMDERAGESRLLAASRGPVFEWSPANSEDFATMMKYRLVTPGPVMAPPDVLLELAKPVFHHRTAENKATIREAIESLQKLFLTKGDVVLFASSGTGAMEASVANTVCPGQPAIVIVAGKWGERWQEIAKTFGANVVPLEVPYGKVVTPVQVAAALEQHPDAAIVCATLSETSTGVAHDIPAIGKLVAKTNALFAVDGISGVGAMECRMDDWNIDLLAVGSQKALMLPPGLAMLGISEKAKKAIEARETPPAYYFHLKKALKAAAEFDTPYTPAHTLISSLVVALRMILKDGIEAVWAQTAAQSRAMLAAIEAIGLAPFAEKPATALTTIRVPDGVDGPKWEKLLEKKYGVKVAGGQGSMKGKIIRVAHMGYVDALDLVGIVAALEWSLTELGHKIPAGAGVAAAVKSLSKDLVG